MRRNELRAETLFEDPDLTLEAVDPCLECGQLGLEVLFREPLLYTFEPSLDLVEPLLNAVQPLLDTIEAPFDAVEPLLDPPQAGYQHLVLGLQAVEALIHFVEVPVDVVEPGFEPLLERAHDALDVGQDDLAVEPRQDRQEIFGHVPYPTPAPAPLGPQYGTGA